MGAQAEKTLMQYCDSVEDCLGWHRSTWLPLQQQLADLAFRWEKFLAEQPAVLGAEGELLRLGQAVSDALLPILDSQYCMSVFSACAPICEDGGAPSGAI